MLLTGLPPIWPWPEWAKQEHRELILSALNEGLPKYPGWAVVNVRPEWVGAREYWAIIDNETSNRVITLRVPFLTFVDLFDEAKTDEIRAWLAQLLREALSE